MPNKNIYAHFVFWVSCVLDNKSDDLIIFDWLLNGHWLIISYLILTLFEGDHEACDSWWLWPSKQMGCQIHPQPYYPVQAQCTKILYSGSAHRYVSAKWKNALSLVRRVCLYITEERRSYTAHAALSTCSISPFSRYFWKFVHEFFHRLNVLIVLILIVWFQEARHWGVTRTW